jgi:hypothetical protein
LQLRDLRDLLGGFGIPRFGVEDVLIGVAQATPAEFLDLGAAERSFDASVDPDEVISSHAR